MRSTVQKILKEAQDYHSSVFLIMSEDEKFVKYNLHVGGEEYFSGGPNQDGWQSSVILDNKNFQEFYINKRQNAEGVISILPQPQLDRYKPKVVEYVMGFFRKDEMSNLFDQINESENTDIGSKHNPHRGDFLLSKKAIFVDGKDQATTVGNFYEIKSIRDEGGAIKTIFINDFDAPHTVTPTNDFFKEYFEYVPREYKDDINIDTSTLFESEEDELEWAQDVINTLPDTAIIGQTYRVTLPEEEKAIIDVLITDIKNGKTYDSTRAIIYDPINTTISDQEEFLRDYNIEEDSTQLKHANHLIQTGHWVPIKLEDSLFKNDKFIHTNIYESEENDFEWVDPPNEEPFHKILMRGQRRRPRLMDEVRTIMFNPPVEIGSQRFNKIAYWLEDHDYYPEELKLEGRTSYIEIIRQKWSSNIRNGRWRIGPELSNQELYELSQTTKNGWNYNFWEDEFIARFYDKEMPD